MCIKQRFFLLLNTLATRMRYSEPGRATPQNRYAFCMTSNHGPCTGRQKALCVAKKEREPCDSPLTLSSVSPEYKALMTDAYINIFILNPALGMPPTDAQCGGGGVETGPSKGDAKLHTKGSI